MERRESKVVDEFPSKRGRGRPRSVELEERMLRAVLEVLAEQGFAGLTLDKVCAHARVPKATFYRRWSNPTEAAVDALHAFQQKATYRDTGDVVNDLSSFLRVLIEFVNDPLCGACRNRLLMEFSGRMSETSSQAAMRLTDVSTANHEANVAMLAGAMERQGIASTLSANLIATTLAALAQQTALGARVNEVEFPALIACLLQRSSSVVSFPPSGTLTDANKRR